MFYVVRKGEGLDMYHYAFHNLKDAKESAENLKKTLGHQYDVIEVKSVWTTQTLADLKAQGAF